MKRILIDNLIGNSSSSTTTIDGVDYTGYNIAKPMNYENDFITDKERIEMAKLVLEGKAIAVSFFSDLTEEEKKEHIMKNV